MRVGEFFERLRRKGGKLPGPSRRKLASQIDTFRAGVAVAKAAKTAQLLNTLAVVDRCHNSSALVPALTPGTKPHSNAYATTFMGNAFSWPVARLDGGEHGPYFVAKVQRGLQGRYGKVRLGIDKNGRQVAIKVLRLTDKRCAPTAQSQYSWALDEVRAMAAMGPDHEALDVICVEEKVYIVMPLAGGDLDGALHPRAAGSAARELMPAQRAQLANSMLSQLSSPLAQLHARGWMHLDLKLSNLLWSSGGLLRVADFGMANRIPCKERRGSICSIAPEVLAGREYGGRADVWSLGACLCEVMTQQNNIFTQYGPANGPKDRWGEDEDIRVTHRNHRAFSVWRSCIRRHRDGRFDLDSIDPRKAPDGLRAWYCQCFVAMREVDANLCQFVLGRMMEVNPQYRATMEEVSEYAATRSECGTQADVAALLREHVPRDPSREGILSLLQQVADSSSGV